MVDSSAFLLDFYSLLICKDCFCFIYPSNTNPTEPPRHKCNVSVKHQVQTPSYKCMLKDPNLAPGALGGL